MSTKGAEPPRRKPLLEPPALRWRIVGILLLVSLLPLALMGVGAWSVLGRIIEEKALELHRTLVETHAANINLYFNKRLRALEFVTRTCPLGELGSQAWLKSVFEGLNSTYQNAFVDLGVISSEGKHLAYVGPFSLMDKDYSKTPWFRSVMAQRSYVSDVFMGYRRVPHVIIAVKSERGPRPWILRATIDSEQFESLVRTGQVGRTGDTFLINAEGIYQTPPRAGRVMDRWSLAPPQHHRGVQDSLISQGTPAIQVTTWLNHDRWMLVVQQDEAEIKAPVRRAMITGAIIIGLAVMLIVATTFFATWHLTNRIDRSNAERDAMARDLLRSGKLASLGEMATGLAHEINNPLAIIGVEQTNIGDLIELPPDTSVTEEIQDSLHRIKRQVDRCASITSKMLQFGRQTETRSQPTSVGPRLEEMVKLMEKQAARRNIQLTLSVEPELPELHLDPIELEQVMFNLMNNSLYAIPGAGKIQVAARRVGREVRIAVSDTGTGISPENLDKIFQPFFTTKPVGKGTGLGLSICYGMVQNWGGSIEVQSQLGTGTTMTIHLPAPETSRPGEESPKAGEGEAA